MFWFRNVTFLLSVLPFGTPINTPTLLDLETDEGKKDVRTYNVMLLDSGIASDFDSFCQFVLSFISSSCLQVCIEYLLYSTKSFVCLSKLRIFLSKNVLSL